MLPRVVFHLGLNLSWTSTITHLPRAFSSIFHLYINHFYEFSTYIKQDVHISRTILTKIHGGRDADTSNDESFFVCSECKTRCRSEDMLNEHMYEEHGKQ